MLHRGLRWPPTFEHWFRVALRTPFQRKHPLTRRDSSLEASPPRHWYLQPCHVDPELLRQWYGTPPAYLFNF
jgi:hypothetical protein